MRAVLVVAGALAGVAACVVAGALVALYFEPEIEAWIVNHR